jgi:hypothetical protein
MNDLQEATKKIEAYLRLTGLTEREYPNEDFFDQSNDEYVVFHPCKEVAILFIDDRKVPISHIRKFANKNLLVRKISQREIRRAFDDRLTQSAFIIIQKESRKNVRKSKKAI